MISRLEQSPFSKSRDGNAKLDESKANGPGTCTNVYQTGLKSLESSHPDEQQQVSIHWLIDHHHAAVYRYAYRLTGNANDAEDLSQQTFLMAHQRLEQLRDLEKCLSWLLSIVRNSFLKMNRRQRPSCAANLELDVDQIQQPMLEKMPIDGERLQMAFDQIDDSHRLILAMFYFEQLSYKQIATQLDVKIGTVMSRLSRAKSRLRASLASLSFTENEIWEK